MRWRHAGTRLTVAVLLAVVAIGWPLPAHAATILSGMQATLQQGETIDDDVYAFGSSVVIDGRITRTLVVTGGTVTVNGQVGGDVIVAGGTVAIHGPVGGSVRIAGGDVTIDAPVGWDVLVGGGNLTLGPNARVRNDLLATAGTMTVDGRVGGDLRGSVGTLRLLGQVGGNVYLDVEQEVSLGPRAVVQGDFVYRAPEAARVDPGARIQGQTRFTQVGPAGGRGQTLQDRVLTWISDVLLRLAWALVAGTLLVILLPRRSARIADTLRQAPLPSLLWGIALVIAVPVIAAVLMVTVIGIPAGLLVLGVYLAALYLSQVFLGISLLRGILPGSWRSERRFPLWLTMLIGTSLVVLIRLVPLPFGIGLWWTAILSFLIAVVALGAIWTDLTGWGRPAPALAPAAEPAPPPVAPAVRPSDTPPPRPVEPSPAEPEERPITQPLITPRRLEVERPATAEHAAPAAGPAMTEPAPTMPPEPERHQPPQPAPGSANQEEQPAGSDDQAPTARAEPAGEEERKES